MANVTGVTQSEDGEIYQICVELTAEGGVGEISVWKGTPPNLSPVDKSVAPKAVLEKIDQMTAYLTKTKPKQKKTNGM